MAAAENGNAGWVKRIAAWRAPALVQAGRRHLRALPGNARPHKRQKFRREIGEWFAHAMQDRFTQPLRRRLQASVKITCPGKVGVITPPQSHMHMQVSSAAGAPRSITVGTPGVHTSVTGMHGIGVSTPKAAAVAAATSGLDGVMHMPNGMMLTIGAASKILAAGISPAVTVGTTTFNAEGATPNVHISTAPSVNCIPIEDLPSCLSG